ncbi:hypothetical protein CAPTEDRAFT_228247 [Capitella teleta]|uniref:Ig-like domain-containing protein n=1 Tax=Capitella teleta TaxID=283909 RepID=R7TKR0_CAPTE|nr:hypothetical protein CAPTEDRAFT_228247 [Capitella teleta]|eukprot:ELT92136.1 hypothetical protein CAPTEDRAFT_228247 [Capitella teleta]
MASPSIRLRWRIHDCNNAQKEAAGLGCLRLSASWCWSREGSPPILVEGPPANEYYPPGKTVKLPCRGEDASQIPNEVEWYHNGRLLDLNENGQYALSASDLSTLVIRTKAGSADGKYRCVLRNAYGSVMSRETQLTVAEFRTVGGVSDRWMVANVSVVEGGPASLPCRHIHSVPNASVTWFTVGCPKYCHDDERVILDDRVTVDQQGTLVFTHIEKDDAQRLYRCIAYNPVLRTSKGGSYARLFVLPNPFSPWRVPSLLLSSQSPPEALLYGHVTLRCVFAGVPTAHVTWKLPDSGRKHETKDFGRELHLADLQLDDAGDYYCTGHNAMGEGAPVTIRLNITSAPHTNTSLSEFIETPAGEEVEVKCDAEGTPPLHYEWFVDGRPLDHEDADLLVLQNITKRTSITCIINNKFGFVVKSTHITLKPEQSSTLPPHHSTTQQHTTAVAMETTTDEVTTGTSSSSSPETQATSAAVLARDGDISLNPGDPDGLHSERSIVHEALTLTAQVMAPLVFLMASASVLLCVCVKARRKKASYRVDYRERHFGLHPECDSDDSGYDEKEEKSVQRRLKRERSKPVEAECHL